MTQISACREEVEKRLKAGAFKNMAELKAMQAKRGSSRDIMPSNMQDQVVINEFFFHKIVGLEVTIEILTEKFLEAVKTIDELVVIANQASGSKTEQNKQMLVPEESVV
jgi:hypothetical protein